MVWFQTLSKTLFHLLVRCVEQLLQGKPPLVRLLRCTQDQLESCIQIVRLQLQRLVQIFHSFFLRRDLFGEIQIIVRCFRRRFFLLFAF